MTLEDKLPDIAPRQACSPSPPPLAVGVAWGSRKVQRSPVSGACRCWPCPCDRVILTLLPSAAIKRGQCMQRFSTGIGHQAERVCDPREKGSARGSPAPALVFTPGFLPSTERRSWNRSAASLAGSRDQRAAGAAGTERAQTRASCVLGAKQCESDTTSPGGLLRHQLGVLQFSTA